MTSFPTFDFPTFDFDRYTDFASALARPKSSFYVGKIICTYAIEHPKCKMPYTGSSEDFAGRWAKHLCTLRRGAHPNYKLQELYDKHNGEGFTIRILKEYPSTDGLQRHETEDTYRFFPGRKFLNGRIGFKKNPDYETRHRERKPIQNPGARAHKTYWTKGATA